MNTDHQPDNGDIVLDFSEDVPHEDKKQQVPPQPAETSQQNQTENQQDLKQYIYNTLGVAESSNPVICIFHLLFKALGIFTYLFSGFFFNSITIFIFVSVLCVLDFWVVKNLSGRILAGLRWWRIINSEGKEEWKFESKDQSTKNNKIDSFVFWYGQILTTIFWFLISLLKLFLFQLFWFILAGTCFFLTATNLYAYYQCRKDYKKKVQELMGGSQMLQGAFISGIRSKLGF